MFWEWLFRRKPKVIAADPTADWPQPMRGDYEVLPLELDWFDWTDYDSAYLTVDGDGTVKLHAGYAHRVGIEWKSLDYTVIGRITPPGAMWVHSYWLRPSWYDELIARSAALEAAWEVAR